MFPRHPLCLLVSGSRRGDGFRSLLPKSPNQTLDLLQHSTYVCRSLNGFSLPASAGLLHRPILLFQDAIFEEISEVAFLFYRKMGRSSTVAYVLGPPYDQKRPPPLRHQPREAPCSCTKATQFRMLSPWLVVVTHAGEGEMMIPNNWLVGCEGICQPTTNDWEWFWCLTLSNRHW